MHICVTHVDAQTGVPCTQAPMSTGPSFPKVKGLNIKFGNQTQWPTNTPMFYGTCDDYADLTVPGVIKAMTPEEYAHAQFMENDTKAAQVRQHRDYLLSTVVDSINPMRWEAMTLEQQDAWRTYRQELLDVPQQAGFPWAINWPTPPTSELLG